jgi:MoxR-like ATPase
MVDETQDSPILSITNALDIHGWNHLDAVLLAALATQSPLLLVGPHGTAKSLLVVKIAHALQYEMRHYNASLLNYDDLVGIPLPDENGEKLHFVATPGSIWDAEFVFFDEISRCRPDLQNKLFPIIHERKVVGIPLHRLRHRWAAMNPPAPDDLDTGSAQGEFYLGSEPLDPALADRFPFVVPVPNWRNLSRDDRRHLITWKDEYILSDRDEIAEATGFTLAQLIDRCQANIPLLEDEVGGWLADYVICVIDLLEQAKLPQSPRRARMLARSILAIHAARMVTEGENADLEYSAQLGLLYGMPQNASEVPPSPATIVATHKQAWEIASLSENDNWRRVLEETDPIKRILVADQLDFADEEFSRLITQALSAEKSDARQVSLATAIFLAYRQRRNLVPAAWEPLSKLAGRVLEPRTVTATVPPGVLANIWKEINEWVDKRPVNGDYVEKLLQNFVFSGFPDLWRNHKWQEELEQFRADLTQFGVKE